LIYAAKYGPMSRNRDECAHEIGTISVRKALVAAEVMKQAARSGSHKDWPSYRPRKRLGKLPRPSRLAPLKRKGER